MLTALQTYPALPDSGVFRKMSHVLVILPAGDDLPADCPDGKLLRATLARRQLDADELCSDPQFANSAEGGLRVWLMLDPAKTTFENLSLLRQGIVILLDEEPVTVDVIISPKMIWWPMSPWPTERPCHIVSRKTRRAHLRRYKFGAALKT